MRQLELVTALRPASVGAGSVEPSSLQSICAASERFSTWGPRAFEK
jgi:hypothetical protein